ncbi:MAG TPA: phosphoribosylformylglycinamidine cyclo-ligase [Acidimicrobiia bacterium]
MTSYRDAGVDLEGADRHVARIAPVVTATWGPNVVGGFGGFAAGIELPEGYRRPVLMMSTDGVGTKLELARRTRQWDGVGFDLVAMCVDDLAAVGARPLGFVDYLAVGALDAERDAAIVASIARACADAGCALVGGETAEHPGVMEPDAVDLAGAVVGVVEKGQEITGATITPGDVIVGLRSPNLRSNGFSLVRRAFADTDLDAPFPGEDASIGEVLLRPSVLYSATVQRALTTGAIHGMAHITGGGIPGNLVRPLPEGTRAVVERSRWGTPAVFDLVQRTGGISDEAMAETFNLGIGFAVICPEDAADEVIRLAGHDATVIGRVVAGERGVDLV